MLGKKGAGFWMLIYSVGLFIVIAGLTVHSFNPDNEFNKFKDNFGSIQGGIVNTFYEAELDLDNSDQKIKYKVFKITNEFGENGGYAKENVCSKKDGFVVIDFESCDPDLKANYLELFKREMEIEDLKLENNFITGSLEDLEYNKELWRGSFNYKIKNNFKQDILLDLEFLGELKSRIKSCLEKEQKLNLCIGVEFEDKGGYAFFTIENDKNGIMILEDGIKVKKPGFKFAVKNDQSKL